MLVYAFVVVRTAWVMDDAYISYRSVDNVIHGDGLRWNVFERVDAFTDPLWTLMLSAFALATDDVFWTGLLLQIVISLTAVWLLATRISRTLVMAVATVLVVSLSKAFVDYSTSGLENPLSHLLIVAFAISYLGPGARTPRALLWQAFGTALAAVNRLDLIWIFGPCLAERVWSMRSSVPIVTRRAIVKALLIGFLPLIAWETFSFFYYGALIPNSALAKLSAHPRRTLLLWHGVSYFRDSALADPITLLVSFLGVTFGLARGQRRTRALGIGAITYLVYVAWVGGDHMSGRFFTVPFLVAVIMLNHSRGSLPGSVLVGTGVASLVAAWMAGFPTLNDQYFALRPGINFDINDYRREWVPSTGLLSRTLDAFEPKHEWVDRGKAAREHPEDVVVWGGVGLAAFYAGPGVRVVDMYGLTDPLLARLPLPDASHETYFKAGHLQRSIPDGYVETVRTGKNVIRHPALHAYYDKLGFVTEGPLWSATRLVEAAKLDLGLYDGLLAEYVKYQDQKPIEASALAKGGALPKQDSQHICPSWWNPCAPAGIAFFKAGVRVTFDDTSHAQSVVVRATPETYTLYFWHNYKELGGVWVGIGRDAVRVPVPTLVQTEGFDAVALVPTHDVATACTLFSCVTAP